MTTCRKGNLLWFLTDLSRNTVARCYLCLKRRPAAGTALLTETRITAEGLLTLLRYHVEAEDGNHCYPHFPSYCHKAPPRSLHSSSPCLLFQVGYVSSPHCLFQYNMEYFSIHLPQVALFLISKSLNTCFPSALCALTCINYPNF